MSIIPHYLEIKLTDEEYKKFRQIVKDKMKAKGWSIRVLAEKVGMNDKTLENFMYGRSKPSRFTAAILANYFHIKAKDFVIEKPKERKGSFFGGWHIGIVLAMLAVPFTLSVLPEETSEAQKIDFSKYIVEAETDIETEVCGVDTQTDFEPSYYEFNPYPDAIVKNIEATAYCYGELTCTGKKIREGIAAMSKQYLGMTAIVYEADKNGEPLDYIGTYEIEDTGGDYRIKNGTCIDIYIPDYAKAKEFGRKQVVVYLLEAKG